MVSFASIADQVDGLWSADCMGISAVVGPATYQIAAKTFQTAASYKGELSAAAYLKMNTGGYWTNARMPAVASTLQQGIALKNGMGVMPASPRTAVMPSWAELTVDDIYSGSASATRFVTMHVLVGDLLIVQPGAYSRLSYKLS